VSLPQTQQSAALQQGENAGLMLLTVLFLIFTWLLYMAPRKYLTVSVDSESIIFNSFGQVNAVMPKGGLLWKWDSRLKDWRSIESYQEQDYAFMFYLGEVSNQVNESARIVCRLKMNSSGDLERYLLWRGFKKEIASYGSLSGVIQFYLALWAEKNRQRLATALPNYDDQRPLFLELTSILDERLLKNSGCLIQEVSFELR